MIVLEKYLEGWRLGDGKMSLQATTPEFFYEDPNTGRIDREHFVTFVEDFKSYVRELINGDLPDPFLTYTDLVIDRSESPHSAWCWWRATNTNFQGSALIKFSDAGVMSERIAYFSRLPA